MVMMMCCISLTLNFFETTSNLSIHVSWITFFIPYNLKYEIVLQHHCSKYNKNLSLGVNNPTLWNITKCETNWSILLLNLKHCFHVFYSSVLKSIILLILRLYSCERRSVVNINSCPKSNANMFMCITQHVVMYKLQQWYLDFIW